MGGGVDMVKGETTLKGQLIGTFNKPHVIFNVNADAHTNITFTSVI